MRKDEIGRSDFQGELSNVLLCVCVCVCVTDSFFNLMFENVLILLLHVWCSISFD